MRISDWSSDVCSSDLPLHDHRQALEGAEQEPGAPAHQFGGVGVALLRHDRAARRPGIGQADEAKGLASRSEEHTSELQSLMRISYAVLCLPKKKLHTVRHANQHT